MMTHPKNRESNGRGGQGLQSGTSRQSDLELVSGETH